MLEDRVPAATPGPDAGEAATRDEAQVSSATLTDSMTSPGSTPGVARALIEVALCSGLPTQLVVLAALSALGLQQGYTVEFFVPLLWLDTLLIVGLSWWFLRGTQDSPSRVWLGTAALGREARFGLLALFPAVTGLVMGVVALLNWAWPWLHNVPDNPLKELLGSQRDVAIMVATVIVAGGLREEMQRAFVLTRFRQSLGGGRIGLLVFSLAFGAGHLLQGWDAAIATVALGLTWGVVYLVRGSIVAPVVSHAAFDVLQVLQFSLTSSP